MSRVSAVFWKCYLFSLKLFLIISLQHYQIPPSPQYSPDVYQSYNFLWTSDIGHLKCTSYFRLGVHNTGKIKNLCLFETGNLVQTRGRFWSSWENNFDCIYYSPQRSWGTVMFLHVCVILFTGGGGSASVHAGIPPWQGRPPGKADTVPRSACWEIWSISGQYASYWNAILVNIKNVFLLVYFTICTARKWSLGEDNVFTLVCESFCSQGGAVLHRGAVLNRGCCS